MTRQDGGLGTVWLHRHHQVFHPALLAPNLRRFALALHIVGVNPARVFDFHDFLLAVHVFHEEIRHVTALGFGRQSRGS